MSLFCVVSAALRHTRGPDGMTDLGPSTGIEWSHLITSTVVLLVGLAAVIVYGRWLYRVWRDRADYPIEQGEQTYMWFCPRCLLPTEEPTGLFGECVCGAELAVVGPDGFEVRSWR